jgi:predicted Zn-dependent peptidase
VDISAAFDAVGGELNAFTGKEFTCYYARVLDDDLPLAVDILGDIVSQPLLASADIEAEREVIAEELAMATDDPGDAVHELFAAALFDGHPLARPILGSSQSVADLSRRQVAGWFKRRYRLPTMVVSAAGNIDHARLVRLVRKAFAGRIAAADAARPDEARTPSSAARRLRRADPSVGADSRLVTRRTEQTHIVVGLPSLPRHDPRRMAVSVVNAALGGGMSSRLFCDIRENRSLAYSVFSYTTAYADAGALAMYAGCLPSKAGQVLDRLRAAATEVAEHGLGEDEVERAKGALRGSLVLGLEEPGSRMSRLGKAELVYPTFKSTDELLAMIDAVTVEQANEVAAQILGVEPTVAVVGPFKSMRALRAGSVGRTR